MDNGQLTTEEKNARIVAALRRVKYDGPPNDLVAAVEWLAERASAAGEYIGMVEALIGERNHWQDEATEATKQKDRVLRAWAVQQEKLLAAPGVTPLVVAEGAGVVECQFCTKRGWAQAGGWYRDGDGVICGECVKFKAGKGN